MQIRKTYKEVNPGLLYDELRDFILKQGVSLSESKIETYALPDDTSTFISRGTLTFKIKGKPGDGDTECLRAHLVGSVKTETKVMIDADDRLFPPEKMSALLADLDFIFGLYEVKPH